MTVIPRSQRENLPPGGSAFPGPSQTRLATAGTTGRGIAGVGQTLNQIGVMAQRANDDAEFTNQTIEMQKAWDLEQEDLLKIKDPNAYEAASKKSLEKVSNNSKKGVNIRNKNRFDRVVGSLGLTASRNIASTKIKKTADNSNAAHNNLKINVKERVLAGGITVEEGEIIIATSNASRESNRIISAEASGKDTTAFREDVAMDNFLKVATENPLETSKMSRVELQKEFRLTGEQATNAKVITNRLNSKQTVKVKSLKSDTLLSMGVTGKSDPNDVATVLGNTEGREKEDYIADLTVENLIFNDSVALKGATANETKGLLSQLKKNVKADVPRNVKRNQHRLDAAKKFIDEQSELRKDDAYASVFEESDASFETVFGTRSETTSDMVDDSLAKQESIGILVDDRRVAPVENLATSSGQVVKGTAAMINEFRNGDALQREQQQQDLTVEYGKHSGELFELLQKDGMPIEFGLMLSTNNSLIKNGLGNTVGVSVEELKKVINDKDKAQDVIDTVTAEMSEDFYPSLQPDNPQQKANFVKTIEKLGLFMASQGVESGEIGDVIRQGLSDDLYEYSGGTLRIPKGLGFNKEKIESFLQIQKSRELLKDPFLIRGDTHKAFVQSQLDDGAWYVNGSGTGARFYVDNVQAVKEHGLRLDGTFKGSGFLGSLQVPGGGIATELSQSSSDMVDNKGNEILFPSLVPILTEQEIEGVLNGTQSRSAFGKAIDHARKRIAQGKSPFFDTPTSQFEPVEFLFEDAMKSDLQLQFNEETGLFDVVTETEEFDFDEELIKEL